MPQYRIRVIREEGPEPVTGEHIEHAEEVVRIEGESPWKAAQRAWTKTGMNAHGRLLRYFDADSGEEITAPRRERVFRAGTFTLDAMEGPYPGYTDDDRWNGWATPYFELDVAKRIAEDYVRTNKEMGGDMAGSRARYDKSEDAFALYEPINDYESFYDAQTITVEGREVKVYPIGTYEWTWEEAEG
jgi:hypothetical protein